jgi:lysophospholipase L1-like esterase
VAAPPAPVLGAPARRFAAPLEIANITDQTVRMIVRTTVGGRRARIRIANAFGATSLAIGAAHIARRQEGSAIVPETDRPLTFGGKTTAVVYAGQVLTSDPVDLAVPPLADMAVTLYIPGDAGLPTSHRFGLRPTYISTPGDFAGAPAIEKLAMTTESYYWLAGLDVLAPAAGGTLVTFGDSITDGDQSTPDTGRMWPAVLATRLQGNAATKNIGVVNAGISGNRLLGDNNSGLVRFVQHALTVPGVKWITVLEGINDISGATRQNPLPGGTAASQASAAFSADDLIRAYRQMIDLAHARGVKVIGCTITPFGGSSTFTERGEAIRTAVNDWIRKSGGFDAVVDFDEATRDRADPRRFRDEADSPDLLHPGDGGYRLMAEAFKLGVFNSAATPARPSTR